MDAQSEAETGGRDGGLLRTIGPAGLAANVFNTVVGAGVFALPAAVGAARQAAEDGADWVDVGGVPFSPGPELPVSEEAGRVVPVIAALRSGGRAASLTDLRPPARSCAPRPSRRAPPNPVPARSNCGP